MQFICEYCGRAEDRPAGHVNRARRRGYRLFCGRRCAGLARRTRKTLAQKRAEKQQYDAEYRLQNKRALKAKKAAYHKRTYDPAKARAERKKRAAEHAEYCRRPEYRKWKREYDRKHRAQKQYGEFWEAFLVLLDVESAIKARATDYEIRMANDTLNKAQKRRREYEKSYGRKSEIGPLGNLERVAIR